MVLAFQVILTVAEHHSCIVPWQIVSQKTGAVLKFVTWNEDEVPDIDMLREMKSHTDFYIDDSQYRRHMLKMIMQGRTRDPEHMITRSPRKDLEGIIMTGKEKVQVGNQTHH
ncbi:hypothetical protein Rs2_15827 [Raphanus sativus]|nr:hypothetical protein Rs2_15827 [Raphanus sativus]